MFGVNESVRKLIVYANRFGKYGKAMYTTMSLNASWRIKSWSASNFNLLTHTHDLRQYISKKPTFSSPRQAPNIYTRRRFTTHRVDQNRNYLLLHNGRDCGCNEDLWLITHSAQVILV